MVIYLSSRQGFSILTQLPDRSAKVWPGSHSPGFHAGTMLCPAFLPLCLSGLPSALCLDSQSVFKWIYVGLAVSSRVLRKHLKPNYKQSCADGSGFFPRTNIGRNRKYNKVAPARSVSDSAPSGYVGGAGCALCYLISLRQLT